MTRTPKLVVLGMMSKMPVAGVVWQTVHYLVGFKRLGYEVYYVEAHARTPSMLMDREDDDSSAKAAAFIANVMVRFDLGDRWAFHALHGDGRCYGMSKPKLDALYRDAALLVNLHGGTEPLPEHSATGRLVYLETDPVQLQVELASGLQSTIDFLEPHCAFFTFAENLGAADCGLPVSDRYHFRPTRQPVVLDFWDKNAGPARNFFTTIGNWRQNWRSVSFCDETYHWSKHHEFEKFLDTPARTGHRFELSLSSVEPDEQQLLQEHGWKVRRALDFSTDVDAYREYVARSRGEFTVAKDQNVRLRTGWFSDRSATYLAAGRPVVTQDTGFGNILPVGRGLFPFSTGEEIVDAIAEINSDYRLQRRAAREIAAEFFDARSVLGRLLEDVGLPSAQPARPSTGVTRSSPAPDERTRTSLVIPCFDLGEYLTEAIESVRAQTLPPDELIVVDDGSSDRATLDVLTALEREGVTVLRTENRGASAARNHGIERARGEFVLCLDADDVLLPRFLERTVAALEENPGAAIAATHVEFFGNAEGVWEPPDFNPTLLLWENCVGSASVFRRSAWRESGGYAALPAFQDWDLWISMIERGWRWVVVPDVLYRYRVRSGSISERGRELRPELLRAIQERHPDTYRKTSADVRIAMDAEIRRLRELVRSHDADIHVKDTEVLSLKEALREHQYAEAATRPPANARAEETQFGRLESIVASVASPDAKLVGAEARGDGSLHLTPLGGWVGDTTTDTRATSSELERLVLQGAEFLLVPPTAQEALEQAPELLRSLECRYYGTLRDEDEGLLFDLRRRLELPSFSVVICTYQRPELLRRSLASALAQDYPNDRFEVVVVDNEPSEQTRAIVAEARLGSPVPLSYFIEERNGLSAARNTGIAHARGEFVAYLDDDASAATHWLAAFATVVNQHGALAVGGRVELSVEPGSTEPPWLEDQYARGFFGLNYRDWGKKERIFRIRRPLYLGGGNSAYAKRLFSYFGGFRADLGRTGGSLMAAEETLLNALLERHDVPLYYSDDAVVDHLISGKRLTKRHVRRKAYWAGVSNAIVEHLLGEERAPAMRKQRGGGNGFELAHDLGLALRRARVSLSERLGRPVQPTQRVNWTTEHWLAEIEQWPEGRAKYEELANAHAVLGHEAEAEEALSRVTAYTAPSTSANVIRTLASRRLLRAQYELLVQDIHRVLNATVPLEARVLIASRGDERLATLEGRQGWHFPQDSQGVYAGYYPADSDEAIAQLEQLRAKGAEFLVFPVTSLWWLEHYLGLAQYLEEHCRLVRRGEPCTIYALREPSDLRRHRSASDPPQRLTVSV
jgi:glycosyltransferase involved in cell wall biosynthesis